MTDGPIRVTEPLLDVLDALLEARDHDVLANDVWALTAPLARRLVVVAARLWARDREQALILGEEWRAYIDDRPGQVLKLCTAIAFLAAAVGRMVGHRLRPRRRRIKPSLGGPSWIASIDLVAAQANAVAVGLLVGLVSSFAPLVVFALDLDIWWAVFGWGLGLAVAVVSVIASVVFGFFIGRRPLTPRAAAPLDGLGDGRTTGPAVTEDLGTAEVPLLVRPFVVHYGRAARRSDFSETGLVRPYIDRDRGTPEV